jgi:hypothetical protein
LLRQNDRCKGSDGLIITYSSNVDVGGEGFSNRDASGISTLGGIVLDAFGHPLANALVTRDNFSTVVVSNESGIFDFGKVSPGTYTVKAKIDGFTGESTAEVKPQMSHYTTVRLTAPLKVKISRSPKKIIHTSGEAITFTATLEPAATTSEAVFHWYVDGVEETSQADTLVKSFSPTKARKDRRKEYTVSVRTVSVVAEMKRVRVAQSEIFESDKILPSNDKLKKYMWTDTKPVQFDSDFSKTWEAGILADRHLALPFKKPHGRLQLGLLPYAEAAAVTAANLTKTNVPPPAVVIIAPRAFEWGDEGLSSIIDHETQHCKHYLKGSLDQSSLWRWLMVRAADSGKQAIFDAFSEPLAYLEHVINEKISYKFMVELPALQRFVSSYNLGINYYDRIKEPSINLSATIKSEAKSVLEECYYKSVEKYPELGEPVSELWDLHIEKPI